MQQDQPTDRPSGLQGFFPFPNRLLSEVKRRPVALLIYAALASTPAIWTRRGKLREFEARASLGELADTTGATRKEVRGALAWLTESRFLTRTEKGIGTRPTTYRIEGSRAHYAKDGNQTTPTPSTKGESAQGHTSEAKGPLEGPLEAQSNGSNGNGLAGVPHLQRAHYGAHVLKDLNTKTTTLPPPPTA